jgi:predicted nucleic acid-binding Zn ribbon protein
VHGVDNTPPGPPSDRHAARPGNDPATPPGDSSEAAEKPRGSDLAREALRAAQASAKSRGRKRRRWSGAGPDDRDPQPLGRVASRIAADRGWAERLAGGQVFGKWAVLVGADIAEHATPVSLDDGVLTVQADSTAWATQLRLLQRTLLAKIAAGVGNGVVKRLKIQAPSSPSWRKGPRHVSGRGPRDTYG